ncbi:protein LNK1-like isoform X3 [Ananas comosus]|uniref:Protein LNK1-like isoform X3 n=1 Tax=Ananas comosus TaxID=4615 RepID=A0A6P5F8Z6_ANACO|nr:protein LNK1-like isoform X3 [Ananas comosus]
MKHEVKSSFLTNIHQQSERAKGERSLLTSRYLCECISLKVSSSIRVWGSYFAQNRHRDWDFSKCEIKLNGVLQLRSRVKCLCDMSDFEIMDLLWEKFSQSDYHIVPILFGEQVNLASNDVGKKPQFVMGNSVGESREVIKSGNSNVCRKEADFCYLSEERSTTAPEGIWSHPLKEISITSYDYVEGSTSSADNPLLGASNTAYECNAGHFSLSGTSSADGGLILTQNGYNHIENDILCYDLPDIGNFDDIDRTFRNYDSTFGQGSSTLDEISRFSMSTPGIYGPEDNFLLDLQCSNLAFVDDTDIMCKPMIQQQAFDKSQGNKIISSYTKKINDSGLNAREDIETSTHKQLKRLRSPEGRRKERISDCTSSNSSCGSKQMRQFSDQKQKYLASDILVHGTYHSQLADPNHFLLPEASGSTQTFNTHEQLGRCLPSQQDLFMHASTSISSQRDNKSSSFLKSPDIILKEMTEELFPEQNLIPAPTMKQQPELLLDTNAVQKQNHKFLKGGENEIRNAGLNIPTVAAGFSPVQKNFYIAAFSEEMSNSIILQQLQGVMDQLNVRMKECIRDSLYRLARSAEQRHSFLTNNSSKGGTGRVLESQDLNRCVASTSVEIETNPIDRSIANLLFHRHAGPIFGLPDYAMLDGPFITNEQL